MEIDTSFPHEIPCVYPMTELRLSSMEKMLLKIKECTKIFYKIPEEIMLKHAMDVKVNVRPIFSNVVHTAVWEGPAA